MLSQTRGILSRNFFEPGLRTPFRGFARPLLSSRLSVNRFQSTRRPHTPPARSSLTLSRSEGTLTATQPGTVTPVPEDPFAHLPPWQPPRKGVLSRLPASWVPYAELMRIEKTGGLYGFYFPYLIGMGWAATIATPALPATGILHVAGVLLAWNIVQRGAVCTINDIFDREYDRQVERCRLRPVARGAVSVKQGYTWYAAQCAVAASIVTFLPNATECFYHAVPIVFLLSVYPLFKRWTDFPQLVLSVPLAWGILMSCSALGVDPFTVQDSATAAATACLVASNAIWIVMLDYVNACQDTKDDIKAGVRSMAVRYKNTKAFYATLGTAQVGLMAAAGVMAGLSPVYFAGACGGNALFIALMARTATRDRPDRCAWWFLRGSILVGGTTAAALFAEYAIGYGKDTGEVKDGQADEI
ncbi:MAG: hypothetical protein Q9160_009099 [Pyrenula sp. 1 TL-2023]